jgi:hypothetical protein
MEEMPDFPIFKVPVCNVLNKKGVTTGIKEDEG